MAKVRSHERLGRVSWRHPSLPYLDERMQPIRQNKAIELYKEQAKLLTCCTPLETPKSPQQALEFLSRTWSPYSSDFFQILSSNNLSSTLEVRSSNHNSRELDEQEAEKNKNNSTKDAGRRMDQTLTMLSSVNLNQSKLHKHKDFHGGWMDLSQVRAWLGGQIMGSLIRGWMMRKNKRKEELRLQTAQVHAALSVARLAAALAGIIGNCYLEPIKSNVTNTNISGRELDKKMNTVVASAAALIATVCAEAAESVGANRAQISSVIRAGLVTQTAADLVTHTATAATCLRGVATLELRAATCTNLSEHKNILEKGAQLRIQMPEGKVHLRRVSAYLKHEKVTLRLGKKHVGGLIRTYKEYGIFDATVDQKEGCYLITLATSGGTIQLLFEDQKQCVMWKSSISNLLSGL